MESSTNIIFLPGTYILNFRWEFYNVSFIQIKSSESDSYAKITCKEEGILLFRNSCNVKISNLELINCNFARETIPKKVYGLIVNVMPSLYIILGCNFTINGITITNTTTGFSIVDVSGDVLLNNVQVYGQYSSRNQIDSFSGNLILYTRTIYKSHLAISGMYVSNCGIMNITVSKRPYITPSGLTLLFNSTEVSATIQDSSFVGNKGQLGGNIMLVLFNIKSSADSFVVSFVNATLKNGVAAYGGGLFITFARSFYPKPNLIDLQYNYAFELDNCIFNDNHALRGGGGLYIQWDKSMIFNGTYHAQIRNSSFIGNSLSHTGAGVALHFNVYVNSPTDHEHKHPKFYVEMDLKNCYFTYHQRNDNHSQSGVIFANSARVMLDSVVISHNGFSGILAIGSEVTFLGSSTITNNSAITGGGIRLCSSSLMYFSNNSELLISRNKAGTIGGGIAVDNRCLVEMPMCFYQFVWKKPSMNIDITNLNVNITLSENQASIAGHNLYGGSIDYCFFYFIKRIQITDRFLHTKPDNSITHPSSVASNPQHVCLVDESNFTCVKKKQGMSIFPGQTVKLKVRVVGQSNGSVPGIIHIDYPQGTVLLSGNDKKAVNLSGEYVEFRLASNNLSANYEEQYFTFHVGVGSSFVIFTEQSRFPPAEIYFRFIPCPNGFALIPQNGSYICDCKKLFPNFIEKCRLDDKAALISKNDNAWIGIKNIRGHQMFLSAKCPLDYCNHTYSQVSLADSKQDMQCKYNRVGILCGSCPSGWSMMFGTLQCNQHCSNLSILLVIPILLAGLLLFILASYLDITVTGGTINGMIFYANILQAYQVDLLVKHPIKYLSTVLKIFLAWFNLDIGIPLCFFKGMNTFSKVMLQGAFPIYLWLIALVVIKLSGRYVRITHLLGKNPVQVLATLILLSYSKMLRVTLVTLKYTHLHCVYKNGTSCYPQPESRWYLDSSKVYMTSYHLVLVVVAVLFVALTFPFTVSLLCIRHIFSLSTFCRCFNFINRLKPFFDAFSGPFKDNATFWPGLLLLVRLILLIVNTLPNEHAYYIITITVSMLSALMVYLNGIYKKRILNIIEHSFLLNLVVIFATLTFTKAENNGCNSFCKLTTYGSLVIAFVTFVGIIGYHLKLKLCNMKHFTSKFTQSIQVFDVSTAVRGRFFRSGHRYSYAEKDLYHDFDQLTDISTRE